MKHTTKEIAPLTATPDAQLTLYTSQLLAARAKNNWSAAELALERIAELGTLSPTQFRPVTLSNLVTSLNNTETMLKTARQSLPIEKSHQLSLTLARVRRHLAPS